MRASVIKEGKQSSNLAGCLHNYDSTTQKRQSGRCSLPTQQKGFRRPSNFGGLPFPKQRLPGLAEWY